METIIFIMAIIIIIETTIIINWKLKKKMSKTQKSRNEEFFQSIKETNQYLKRLEEELPDLNNRK
ncbi:MAG: hypothetical protein WCK37_03275 [Candidatus Falkowbacteria bacterium]